MPEPTPSPGALGIVCPQSIELITSTQSPTVVSFSDPIDAATGDAVDLATCTPASGSTFPIGSTSVSCASGPTNQVVASCAFSVTVISQSLRTTEFLAFGDSITVGFIPHASTSLPGVAALPPTTLGFDRLFHNPPDRRLGYPFKLNELLSARYPGQAIEVVNIGVGGETTNEGRIRLGALLNALSPDVLLLLEGSNDVRFFPPSTTLANLREMARGAHDRGIEVLLATIPPITNPRDTLEQTRALQINDGIRALAAELGIGPSVDVARVTGNAPGLLSFDGRHPTELGYTAIADAFFTEVVTRFEETSQDD